MINSMKLGDYVNMMEILAYSWHYPHWYVGLFLFLSLHLSASRHYPVRDENHLQLRPPVLTIHSAFTLAQENSLAQHGGAVGNAWYP